MPSPDINICHNDHPFEPGIDSDDPANPDWRWCNVCGECRPDWSAVSSPEGNTPTDG